LAWPEKSERPGPSGAGEEVAGFFGKIFALKVVFLSNPQMLSVWYIYLAFTPQNYPNVGKYTNRTLSIWDFVFLKSGGATSFSELHMKIEYSNTGQFAPVNYNQVQRKGTC